MWKKLIFKWTKLINIRRVKRFPQFARISTRSDRNSHYERLHHTHTLTQRRPLARSSWGKNPIINQNLAIGDKASTHCRQLLLAKRLGMGYWVFRTRYCGPHRKLAKNNSHATGFRGNLDRQWCSQCNYQKRINHDDRSDRSGIVRTFQQFGSKSRNKGERKAKEEEENSRLATQIKFV